MGISPWKAGLLVAERYRLQERIGKGGMGEVWRAQHVKLQSPVAIKLLLQEVTASESASARFLREARAAAALRSSNVVQVLDYGVENGRAYLAMEYLEGESLRARLARDAPLTPEATAQILTGVGRAVARAHKKGIVHRDLKPGNIQLVPEDDGEVVKVLDFGIAKVVIPNEAMDGEHSTQTGAMIGTPFYMSPEQARGREIDHRTDVWAIGVIAYECLLAKRPFDAETLGELILQVCTEPPPIPSEQGAVVEGFDAWFATATARDRDARFGSVRLQMEALRGILLDESAPASRRALEASRGSNAPTATGAPPNSERPSEPLADTSLTQSRTLDSSAPPRSRADAGSQRGLMLAGLAAIAAVVVVIAMSSGSSTPDPAAQTPTDTASAASAAPTTPPAETPPDPAPPAPPTATASASTTAEVVAPEPKPSPSLPRLPVALPKPPPIEKAVPDLHEKQPGDLGI